ncbi:uncharacterized protein LOC144138970 [Haemaphysalis longicornis]
MAQNETVYAATLCLKDQARYSEKVVLCGVDPFELSESDCVRDVNLWPRVDAADISEFLVLRTSFITRQQLKARKALEGHNFVTSGWVREPWVKEVSSHSVVLKTKVNHSQSLNKPPVDSWVLCKSDGEVVAAHCTCMAGNGEACSHVAALLFYIEYGVRVRQERSCTDGANSWLPTHIKKVDVRPISAMDFASSTMKKRRLGADASANSEPKALAEPAAPTEDEWTR